MVRNNYREQDQDDDRAGVDDHLHRGEEVGVLEHEQHRHADQRLDQEERGAPT